MDAGNSGAMDSGAMDAGDSGAMDSGAMDAGNSGAMDSGAMDAAGVDAGLVQPAITMAMPMSAVAAMVRGAAPGERIDRVKVRPLSRP